jgi:FtsZ-interacting cell division protein ZipA
MNWTILIIVGILALVLIVFTTIRNQKDKKDLEKELNDDYSKLNEDLEEDEF